MNARVAEWHGAMAIKAYRKRDYETYIRHIRIADIYWSKCK